MWACSAFEWDRRVRSLCGRACRRSRDGPVWDGDVGEGVSSGSGVGVSSGELSASRRLDGDPLGRMRFCSRKLWDGALRWLDLPDALGRTLGAPAGIPWDTCAFVHRNCGCYYTADVSLRKAYSFRKQPDQFFCPQFQ